jgi:hypothetical protein
VLLALGLAVLKSKAAMRQHSVVYQKAFFDLQWDFAHKVALISGRPLTQVLLQYTNFYIRFGLGRDFDPMHPTWQAYLAGLQEAHDEREWTYRFYLMHATGAMPPVVAQCGCFSYALLGKNRIRLHFQNTDIEPCSSLGNCYLEQRRTDLAALFRHVQQNMNDHVRVVGVSWLYNLPAYRRLFPHHTLQQHASYLLAFIPCRCGGNFWIAMETRKRA